MAKWPAKYLWVLAGAVALVIVGIAVWVTNRGGPQPPRARQYTAFDACLLTDEQGVSGPAAAAVWSGMQAASLKTLGKVSYLAVDGPDTAANAVPYVNTLVQRHCDLVLAVGASEVVAAQGQARTFTSTRFVLVGSGSSAANVTLVPAGPAPQVSAAVARIVTEAASRVHR